MIMVYLFIVFDEIIDIIVVYVFGIVIVLILNVIGISGVFEINV